jgi:hypothetical protein
LRGRLLQVIACANLHERGREGSEETVGRR